MYNNESNSNSSNIFESKIGSLNTAPTRISGQYKIVIALDGFIYLDDYNNRRVAVDMTKKFLPQVANFLKIKTEIVDKNNLKYGAFQRLGQKYYHIPLYLNENKNYPILPKYAVITRAVNEEIKDVSKLQRYGGIIKIDDIEKCGLANIFQEILDACSDYPVYFNLEDRNYTIYGYSITEECYVRKTIDMTNSMANQPYVDVFNNKVLLAFKNNDIFFPRFINLEFEFSYDDNVKPFNNFYGFLSFGKEISVEEFDPNILTINVKDYGDYISWSQERYTEEVSVEQYRKELFNVSTIPSSIQNSQVRFRCPTIYSNDVFTIYNPNKTIFYQHIVTVEEIIETSLYKTLIQLCRKMTNECGRNFVFSVDENLVITIKSNIASIDEELFSVEIPSYCIILDRISKEDENYYQFRGVTSYDVHLSSFINIDIKNLVVELDNEFYNVIDRFYVDGEFYIRCIGIENPNDYPVLNNNSEALFFEIKNSKIYQLPPIDIFDVNCNLLALPQYEKEKYVENLKELFWDIPEDATQDQKIANQKFREALEEFSNYTYKDMLPYVKDNNSLKELEESDVVYQENYNDEEIKTLMFNSPGQNGFIVPHIMNIDKQFFTRNGCSDYNLVDTDQYAFHWFLIKGTCPEYLRNDIRSLRYFGGEDDTRENKVPKICSRIIRVFDDYCETIFLGVKYMLPTKYENWSFAVYVDFQNTLDFETVYKMEIDERAKTMYLVVSRFIDFVDLIRGGSVYNSPLIDLSFFYSVQNAYNSQSEFLDGFTSQGILMCDDTIPVMYNGNPTNDWKIEDGDSWKVCLKRSVVSQDADFRTLFPKNGDFEFYLYSDVLYNGRKYMYISMSIRLKNIAEVAEDYVWAEDIQIKFFDTKEFFVQKMKDGTIPAVQEIFQVSRDNIINLTNQSDGFYGDNVKTATLLIRRYVGETQTPVDSYETFELLLPDKIFSLTQNYFEIERTMTPSLSGNGEIEVSYSKFAFPNFIKPNWGIQDFINQFDIESFDNDTWNSKITLFNRNQLWLFIKEYMVIDAKFKYSTSEQIRRLMNNFLIDGLVTYTKYNSIPIRKFNDSVDVLETNVFGYVPLKLQSVDYNYVIWNVITNSGYQDKTFVLNRYKSPFLPYLKKLQNEIDFQREKYKNTGKIFNIYDPDFAGEGISATAYWDEVQGNIVSSLFCKQKQIEISTIYSERVNWYNLFRDQLSLDEAIIVNNNESHIKLTDENINDYILEKYTSYVLNFYKLFEVRNDLNQKLTFSYDEKDKKYIRVQKTTNTTSYTLKLIFTRKK